MTRREVMNSPDYVVDSVVKIAGTNWDRRRVVTKSMRRRMIQMFEAGKSISTIANHFSVSFDSVKRAVNESYNNSEKERKKQLARKKKYTTVYDPMVNKERVNYKRNLLREKRSVVIS